jgi:DNA-binding NarL/FixJ family response regulator
VLLIDSIEIYRAGLVQCINQNPKLELVGVISSVDDLPAGTFTDVDVIILDMDVDRASSLRLLKQLAHSGHNAVLPISIHERDIDLVTAYALHCPGWLKRSLSPASLLRAIQFAPKCSVFSADQVRKILIWKNSIGCQLIGLRSRDLEILWMVLKGKSNAEISEELSLSESTVEKYVSCILQRFKQSSRATLIPFLYVNHLDALEYYPLDMIELIAVD